MVLINLKLADESQFYFTSTCGTTIDDLRKEATHLLALKNGLEVVAEVAEKIAVQGPAALNKSEESTQSGAETNDDTLPPIENLSISEPVSDEITSAIKAAVSDALKVLSKETVAAKVPLTVDALKVSINIIQTSVNKAFPSVPILLSQDEVVDDSDIILWWANKELQSGELLSKYIGKNEKTTIVVKLTKANVLQKGSGPPPREPGLDAEAQKNMYSYYFKKQEEQKKLEENSEDAYFNSPWANPKSLKSTFTGMGNITWR